MNKLPVAKHLSDEDYKVFLLAYATHNSSMDLEERKKYTLSDVVKVEKNLIENCLDVYYKDGKSWHYVTNDVWYKNN